MERDTDPWLAAMSAVMRNRDAPRRIREDFAGFLRQHGVATSELGAAIERGSDRMLVYRRLVQQRLRRTIAEFIPRTVTCLGHPQWARDFALWMEVQGPQSVYLRDVPGEFVRWAAPRWATDRSIAQHLPDLARHEIADVEVRNDPKGGEPPTDHPIALDRPVLFDGSLRVLRYAFAIHRIRLEAAGDDAVAPQATALLVYRDTDDKTRYLQLTPFAATLMELLLAQRPLESALRTICETPSGPLADENLATAATLLANLADRNIVRGAG